MEWKNHWRWYDISLCAVAQYSAIWQNFTGQYSYGFTCYPEYITVIDCLNACVNIITSCVAADIRITTDGHVYCYLHSNRNDLLSQVTDPQCQQYVLVARCSQQGNPTYLLMLAIQQKQIKQNKVMSNEFNGAFNQYI